MANLVISFGLNFIFVICCTVCGILLLSIGLAAFGKSLGLRQFYINVLLQVFEVKL